MPSHKTGQPHMPWQYCGSMDHQSNTCPQVEICPTCRTKHHNPLYICPLLKNSKGQEKDYKGYKYDEPVLGYAQVSHEPRNNVVKAQVSSVIALTTSIISPPNT